MKVEDVPSYTRVADLKRLDFIKNSLAKSIPPNGSVLDVGCGNGIISLQLGQEGYTVHGIDMSEKSIENALQKNQFPNVKFSVLDAETIKASGQRYDAIVCSEVLEHLHQPGNLLLQLYHILQDNGVLLVTVPNGTGPRESLVTKPFLSLRKKNNWMWRTVIQAKKMLGYSGTTIQSEADNLDHIQFFAYKGLLQLSKETGFNIDTIKSSNFIDDIFPVSIISRKLKFLQKWDSHLADILPRSFTGGYLMVWKKDPTYGK